MEDSLQRRKHKLSFDTKCVEVSQERQDFRLYGSFGLMASVCSTENRLVLASIQFFGFVNTDLKRWFMASSISR